MGNYNHRERIKTAVKSCMFTFIGLCLMNAFFIWIMYLNGWNINVVVLNGLYSFMLTFTYINFLAEYVRDLIVATIDYIKLDT